MFERKNIGAAYAGIIYSVFLLFTCINDLFQCLNPGPNGEVPKGPWEFIYTFTKQSNLIVLMWLILFAIAVFGNKEKLFNFVTNKLTMVSVTFYITVTFLIVAFVLTPITKGDWNPVTDYSEFFSHNVSAVVMWFMLFFVTGTGEDLKPKQFLVILIYPTLYVCLNEWAGANLTFTNGEPAYAYAFLNPANYSSISGLIIFIGALYVIFIIIGLLMFKFKNYADKLEK